MIAKVQSATTAPIRGRKRRLPVKHFISFVIAIIMMSLFTACGGGTGVGGNNNVNNSNQNGNDNQNVNNNDNTNQNNNNTNLTTVYFTQSYTDATELVVYEPDVNLINLQLANEAEDATVTKLSFISLSVHGDDISAPSLYNNGVFVAAGTWDVPQLRLTFDLSASPLSLTKEQGLSLDVKAQITGSVCGNMNFYFEPEQSSAVGKDYGLNLPFAASPENESPTNKLIVGNAVYIGTSLNTPPMNGTISQNTDEALLLELGIYAGEDITFSTYSYNLYLTTSQATLRNFTTWAVNDASEWVVVGGPITPSEWDCSNGVCAIAIPDMVDIKKCEYTLLRSTIDVQSMAIGSELRLAFDTTLLEAVSADTQDPLPAEHIIGGDEVTGFTQTIVQ